MEGSSSGDSMQPSDWISPSLVGMYGELRWPSFSKFRLLYEHHDRSTQSQRWCLQWYLRGKHDVTTTTGNRRFEMDAKPYKLNVLYRHYISFCIHHSQFRPLIINHYPNNHGTTSLFHHRHLDRISELSWSRNVFPRATRSLQPPGTPRS